MKRLAAIVLAATLSVGCATNKTSESNNQPKTQEQPTRTHQPIEYAKQETKDVELYLLNTSGVKDQMTWTRLAKQTNSDVFYIKPPNNEQYTSTIQAKNLTEALQPRAGLQEYLKQARRTTNTILFEEHRIIDAPTYTHKQNNLIYYFFDKNNDGKIHNFLDAMQVVKLNNQQDNTSIYLKHIHPTSNNRPLPPRRYFHLTEHNYAPFIDESQRVAEQPTTSSQSTSH